MVVSNTCPSEDRHAELPLKTTPDSWLDRRFVAKSLPLLPPPAAEAIRLWADQSQRWGAKRDTAEDPRYFIILYQRRVL